MLWTQSQKQHVHETARLRIKAGRFPNPRAGSRLTSDKSRVRESRTPGSVRGDRGNPLPYRDLRVLPALTHSRRGETVHSMTCVLRAKTHTGIATKIEFSRRSGIRLEATREISLSRAQCRKACTAVRGVDDLNSSFRVCLWPGFPNSPSNSHSSGDEDGPRRYPLTHMLI